MLFAIDVGNTQTTAAVFRHDKICAGWRFPTDRSQSADGFAARHIDKGLLDEIVSKNLR